MDGFMKDRADKQPRYSRGLSLELSIPILLLHARLKSIHIIVPAFF